MNQALLITICTFFFLQQSIAQGQLIPIPEGNVPARELTSHQLYPDDQGNCGTDDRHEHLMATDATYRKNFLFHTHQLDSVLNSKPHDRSALPPQYTIPVVVHVIHLGEPVGTGSNISDAQILDAINGLNERFANSNGQGADCEIDFCLAAQTPDGCPTKGINRVNGSDEPGYAIEGIEYNTPWVQMKQPSRSLADGHHWIIIMSGSSMISVVIGQAMHTFPMVGTWMEQ